MASRYNAAVLVSLVFLIGLEIGRLCPGTSWPGQAAGLLAAANPAVPPAAALAEPATTPVQLQSGPVSAKLQLSLSATARPSLAVIGGAKCGSSDVWNYLTQRFHFAPGEVVRPSGEVVHSKEMWCLAKEEHKAVRRCYDRYYARVPEDALTIDGTPTYIHLYDRHTQFVGNCETSAQFLATAAPETAVLALLRDPVLRARSEFSWSRRANGGQFNDFLASDINPQVDVELEYLTRGPQRRSFDLLFRELGAVSASKVAHSYRELLDGYHMWLAQRPELCGKVSRKPVAKVGSEDTPWCETWPVLIPSLWYPLLLQWRAAAPGPGRMAVVQSEAYYARNDILDEIMPMKPAGEFHRRGKGNANKQRYVHGDSKYSEQIKQRLREFFELPNRRLRELLRRLPGEGVPVVPPVDEPGSWWSA